MKQRRFTQHSNFNLFLEKVIKTNVYFYKLAFEIKKVLLKNFFYEEDFKGFLKINKEITASINVIDIGGNVGQSIHFFKKYFNKIYSFEPQKSNYDYLKKEFKNNKNIEIFNYALGHKNEIKKLYIPFYKGIKLHHCASFFEHEAKNTLQEFLNINPEKIKLKTEKINMARLDDFNIPNVGIIKIDTEGYENFVLMGMKGILTNDIIIILEYSETSFKESEKILNTNGFDAYRFDKNQFYKGASSKSLNIYFFKKNTKKFSFIHKEINKGNKKLN